jgi:hypothetical protein
LNRVSDHHSVGNYGSFDTVPVGRGVKRGAVSFSRIA